MNQFLKKIFFFFIMVGCLNTFAQDDIFGEKEERKFEPKFTLGTGIYTLNGDIKDENSALLKGKAGFHARIKFDLHKNFLFLKHMDLSFLLHKTSFSADNQLESFSSEVKAIP